MEQSKKSYADTAKPQAKVYSREQGITFPMFSDNPDTAEKYLDDIADGGSIDPESVNYASRISKKRLCIYFDSKETTEKFMRRGYVIVENQKIFARRLAIPSEKLVISNAGPV